MKQLILTKEKVTEIWVWSLEKMKMVKIVCTVVVVVEGGGEGAGCVVVKGGGAKENKSGE